jgi:hypothetical protein
LKQLLYLKRMFERIAPRGNGFREGQNPDGTPIPGFQPVENKQTQKKGGIAAGFGANGQGRRGKSFTEQHNWMKVGKVGTIEPIRRLAVMPKV